MRTVPPSHTETGPAALQGADLDALATALHVQTALGVQDTGPDSDPGDEGDDGSEHAS